MNTDHFWITLAAGTAGCMLVMAVLWVRATARRDASIVDVAWAGLLGLLAIAYAVLADGNPQRRVLVAAIGGIWGVRLAGHLLIDRVLRATEEDGRYQALRASWGEHATRNFFVFFQAQGVLAALLSIPFALAAFSAAEAGITDAAALGLWITGFAGEAAADRQLAVWRRDPRNRGRTCRAGLWRYSRHPNYFFEWLMWCAFALAAWTAPWGWTAPLAPALMLFLIVKVTGIPPTEARAMHSRGEDYRRYQRTTSAFVPWFPRSDDPDAPILPGA